jgi:DNA replication initiation complex subunit (GINS family)
MAEITYQDLFAIYRQEKGSNALCELPEGFDESLRGMVSSLHSKSKSDAQALKELETARKLAISIIQLRRQKIVLRAVSSEDAKLMGANSREQDFYVHMKNMCSKQDLWLDKVISSVQAKEEEKGQVRILQPVPQYTASDGNAYGPFSAGDEALLPKTEAKWMVEGKIAQDIFEKPAGADKKEAGNGVAQAAGSHKP